MSSKLNDKQDKEKVVNRDIIDKNYSNKDIQNTNNLNLKLSNGVDLKNLNLGDMSQPKLFETFLLFQKFVNTQNENTDNSKEFALLSDAIQNNININKINSNNINDSNKFNNFNEKGNDNIPVDQISNKKITFSNSNSNNNFDKKNKEITYTNESPNLNSCKILF